MKINRNSMIQLLILLLLGSAVVLTLLLPQMPGSSRQVQPVEVSVVIREEESALWSNVRLGLEEAAGDLGGEIRFLTLTQANDGTEQESILRREAEGGADALVVVAADPQQLGEKLKEIVGQCPVISVESAVEGAALTIMPDNEAIGRALAQAALEDGTEGVVLLLDTGGSSTAISDRLTAAQKTLEGAGMQVERRIARSGSLTSVLSPLIQETGAARIMTFELSATEQALQAIEEGDLPQLLYGVGVSAHVAAGLERGDAAAVAAWSDYAAGYLAAQGAIQAARGEAVQTEPLAFYVVRGENIYDPENQKLLFPVIS